MTNHEHSVFLVTGVLDAHVVHRGEHKFSSSGTYIFEDIQPSIADI
jgi:hypothetical protein